MFLNVFSTKNEKSSLILTRDAHTFMKDKNRCFERYHKCIYLIPQKL